MEMWQSVRQEVSSNKMEEPEYVDLWHSATHAYRTHKRWGERFLSKRYQEGPDSEDIDP